MEKEELKKQSQEPKDRIIDVSARLFALKGFDAVGVREIAKEADVNISMISYYFGGKIGVLVEIINWYFEEMKNIIRNSIIKAENHEVAFKMYMQQLVALVRISPNKCKVAVLELPYNEPDIVELRVQLIHSLVDVVKEAFGKDHAPPHPESNSLTTKLKAIIGPAMVSLVFSNFIVGDNARRTFGIDFDDDFYDLYTEVIPIIFVKGVSGLSEIYKNKDQQSENFKKIIDKLERIG